jgi:hypothetical protein
MQLQRRLEGLDDIEEEIRIYEELNTNKSQSPVVSLNNAEGTMDGVSKHSLTAPPTVTDENTNLVMDEKEKSTNNENQNLTIENTTDDDIMDTVDDSMEFAKPPSIKQTTVETVYEPTNVPNLIDDVTTTTQSQSNTKNTLPTQESIESSKISTEQSKTADNITTTTTKMSKNALLARIIAKQNEMKNSKTSSSSLPLPVNPMSVSAEKEKIMRVLNNECDSIETSSPPSFQKAMECMSQQQKVVQKVVEDDAPPAFESIENELSQYIGIPSAPPIADMINTEQQYCESNIANDIDKITPMSVPATCESSASTVNDYEVMESDLFDFKIDGMPLSQEERRKMMEEQRSILERIQKEADENIASEAAARAAEFEMRSNTAAAAAAGGSATSLTQSNQNSTLENRSSNTNTTTTTTFSSPQMVDIGGGKRVSLHGQDRTKAAIMEGTAILVQCLGCLNWMQVTSSATLMYCPVCNVVSPVVQEDGVRSQEEAQQMDRDRKLAEQLQQQENSASSGEASSMYQFPGMRRGTGSNVDTVQDNDTYSWWDSFTSLFSSTESTTPTRSAEISVTRPPGSMTPSQRMLHDSINEENTSTRTHHHDHDLELNVENRPLLEGEDSDAYEHTARVAEDRPFYSCVVQSISNTASALGSMIGTESESNEDDVEYTPFLSRNDRGEASGGDYYAITD